MISGTAQIPDGYRHYLIKFPAEEDRADIGSVEAAYALMAEEAGLVLPATTLFETPAGGRYFGAERFDREGNERRHAHTLGGLLHASHRIPSMDYDGFLRATRALTKDERQVEEAFRRMVFNVFAHNRDDHVKNVSYLMDRSGEWRLSPAYDLVFSEGPVGQHSMAVAGNAVDPTERDILAVAGSCDVDLRRAREIMEQVGDAVRQWPRFAQRTGVPPTTARKIGRVIAAG